jgi:hypothetical protein
MLQPTQITLFVLLWYMTLIGGAMTGVVCGAQAFGVLGAIVGGVIGLVVGANRVACWRAGYGILNFIVSAM